MAKNLIKIQRDGKFKDVIITESGSVITIYSNKKLGDIIKQDLEYIGFKKEQIIGINQSLQNLKTLITEQGFKLRLDETEKGYKLIANKGVCSASFLANKEQGVENVLQQAEDWAEELLEELNKNTTNNV